MNASVLCYGTALLVSCACVLRAQTGTASAPAAPATSSGVELGDFRAAQFVDSDGNTLSYRILLPEDYDRARRYPLVLFLHGAGERGADNQRHLVHVARLFLDPTHRREHPAIVVAPQCPADRYWVDLSIRRKLYAREPQDFSEVFAPPVPELVLVKKLLDQTMIEQSVDPDRVYVTGLSMGAFGTYELLARWPETFAAAVAVCGGGNIEVTKRYAPHAAVWITHGDEDPIVPVQFSRDLYAALKRHGADVKYTEFRGVKHDAWVPTYATPDLFTWMFSKSRKLRPTTR
jgi:predicted peptidase